jgi:hypothetical protein
MAFHDFERLASVDGRLGAATGGRQTSEMAAAYHFFVIHDKNAGCVVHLTTSSIPSNQVDAIHVPAPAVSVRAWIKADKSTDWNLRHRAGAGEREAFSNGEYVFPVHSGNG